MRGWLSNVPIVPREDVPEGWVFITDEDDNLVPLGAFIPDDADADDPALD